MNIMKKKKDVNVNINADFGKSGKCKCKGGKNTGCGMCAYFLGFIGATVYYIGIAPSFWVGVLGFLKALVWPAFLVFELLKFLGA